MKYIIALYFIIISSTAFYGKNNTKIITQSDTIKPIEKAEDQPERENCKIIQLPNETLNVLVENKTEYALDWCNSYWNFNGISKLYNQYTN
jgi:hypothetical protein